MIINKKIPRTSSYSAFKTKSVKNVNGVDTEIVNFRTVVSLESLSTKKEKLLKELAEIDKAIDDVTTALENEPEEIKDPADPEESIK